MEGRAAASTATSSTRRPISISSRSSATSASARSGARTTSMSSRGLAGTFAWVRSRSSGARSSACSLPTSSRRRDMREFLLPSFDVIRIPQWAARAEYFAGDSHLEFIWIPVPVFDRIGKPGADFYPAPLPSPTPASCRRTVSGSAIARTAISAIRTTACAPIRSSPAGTLRRSTTGASSTQPTFYRLPIRQRPGSRSSSSLDTTGSGRRGHGEQGPRRGRAARRGGLCERPRLQRDRISSVPQGVVKRNRRSITSSASSSRCRATRVSTCRGFSEPFSAAARATS